MIDPSVSVVGTQLSSTLLVVGSMQALKKAKWFPLVQEGQKVLNRAVSIGAAAFISAGIHYTWDPLANNGTLVLTGLSIWAIAHALFHVAAQYIYQETGYTVLQSLQAIAKAAESPKP